ncbi:MAG: hypothetical protein E3J63_01210 [Elusimicrobia bacterium]|nr:MAG: hypothetical protein E3J63_01210 [Elusimicrobiota bacterium]
MKFFLIFANGICVGLAGFIFLYFLKYNFISWVMTDIPSLIQMFVVFALIFGKKILMNISIPFLLFYGAGGFFLFDWSSRTMPAQISHSIMILTTLYIIYLMITRWEIGKLVIGIMLGIILFVPFRVCEIYYLKAHPEVKSHFEFFRSK